MEETGAYQKLPMTGNFVKHNNFMPHKRERLKGEVLWEEKGIVLKLNSYRSGFKTIWGFKQRENNNVIV